MTVIWFFAQETVKILLKHENIIFIKFMEKGVKKVGTLRIWRYDQKLTTYLKLLSATFYQIIKFLFFHEMIALQKLWKMFFISSKKLFSFSRYSSFCNIFPFSPNFPDSKGQKEVE